MTSCNVCLKPSHSDRFEQRLLYRKMIVEAPHARWSGFSHEQKQLRVVYSYKNKIINDDVKWFT